MGYLIRNFEKVDQEAVKTLILQGLAEHFGRINPTLNPDLNDIYQSYIIPGYCFLVVEAGGEIIGTAALITESPAVGRIVRVTVRPDQRRSGIGRLLVERLIETAAEKGYAKLLVETNWDWYDAIRLYERCGFVAFGRKGEDIHFSLDL